MPGLLIVAHAPLASALKLVGEHAFPEAGQRAEAIDVSADASPEDTAVKVRDALARVRNPDALILTDIFGATPSNIAQQVAGQLSGQAAVQVKVVAGMNVPMLWRALCCTDIPLDDLVTRVMEAAARGVMHSSSSKPQNQAQKTGSNDQDPSKHHQ